MATSVERNEQVYDDPASVMRCRHPKRQSFCSGSKTYISGCAI